MDKKQRLFFFGRPFSPLYGLLMRMRESCYRRGIFRSTRLPVPVISVGNLTLGGTGKTPMVQHLAILLRDHGFHPAVISRGYGGSTRQPVNVVSDATRVLLPADLVGDEPRLLAETLPGVPVLTGVVRKLPARRAVEMGADVLLLDDGFQHLALQRDLDLVLFSADHLAGNSRIFPGGDLREPVAALHRCSCFVLTGVNDANRERASRFADLLRTRFPGKEVYMVKRMTSGFTRRAEGGGLELLDTRPSGLDNALAVCGIARPESFRATLEENNITPLDFVVFDDHHMYKERDVHVLVKKIQASGAASLITTEKDMVKLGDAELGVPVHGLRVAVSPGPDFNGMTIDTVTACRQGNDAI